MVGKVSISVIKGFQHRRFVVMGGGGMTERQVKYGGKILILFDDIFLKRILSL